MEYYINTYGCQMNVHESEKIAGILEGKGFAPASKIEDADILVYNTCCVRETAENKIFGHLGRAKRLKEKNRNIKIVLCGCMPQKPDEMEKLRRRLPHVDLIIGTHNLYLLGEYLDIIQSGGRHFEVWESARDLTPAPTLRTNKLSAFVGIMQGCNNFCTYCIVPYVRGRERSRPASEIVAEVTGLIKDGYREITLLGQNVNSFGKDNNENFCDLLAEINNINIKTDGEKTRFKIKFMTSHPKDLSEEVIKTIADGRNLAKYIHLPVQSGSNRILQLMNRPYTREQYLALVSLIRKYMPEAGLSSDLMVGFPSENEADFLDSLRLVDEVRFNSLFTFIYNRRSGTKADLMKEQIPESVKTERIEQVIARQAELGAQDAVAAVGKVFEVLCDKTEGGFGFGKSWEDRSVRFAADSSYYGKFVRVRITESVNTKLLGEIVGD